MPLKLYNTLTRTIEPLRPIDPARVTFYTCGPTVYDDAHIGNFRSFLAADVLRRFVESPLCDLQNDPPKGFTARRVVHVMNITDVGHMTDDAEGGESGEDRMAVAGKRILEQKKAGKLPADSKLDPANPYDIAAFYAGRFLDDARHLGLKVAIEAEKDPTLMPRATANVPGMIRIVALLIERGHAYVVGSPGSRVVYFDVRSFEAYGKLSGNTIDSLREGAGGRIASENQSGKKDPADFLLWKEDPSHLMKWDSPWGAGYPGWHIECSVMSAARLAAAAQKAGRPLTPDELVNVVIANADPIIDIHSGGEDNIFPHHECELAQSCCAFNASHTGSYAGMWFHPRFLFVEGAKMSKSKGNFFTARDLFAKGFEPAVLRHELVKTHYRSNANFTMQGLNDSFAQVMTWSNQICTLQYFSTRPDAMQATLEQVESAVKAATTAFTDALSADLNISGAIGALNTLMREVAAVVPGDQFAPPSSHYQTARQDAHRILWSQKSLGEPRVDRILGFLRLSHAVLGTLELAPPALSVAGTDIGVFIGCDPDPAVIAKLHDRVAAKKAKDFAKSDAIRDELAKAGYAIKDVAGGKVEVRRA